MSAAIDLFATPHAPSIGNRRILSISGRIGHGK
jgi:hypothetical protein